MCGVAGPMFQINLIKSHKHLFVETLFAVRVCVVACVLCQDQFVCIERCALVAVTFSTMTLGGVQFQTFVHDHIVLLDQS